MRVLALVTDAFGGNGGIARYNRDFLTALAAAPGIENVTVLPRLTPQPTEALPPGVHQEVAVYGQLRYSIAAARAACRTQKPSALFCGHIHLAPLATALARLMRIPLWLQVHGIDVWTPPSRQVRWCAERADLITSVSRYTRHRMIGSWWGGDPARIRVLPNTVSDKFAPGPKPATLCERYGLAGKKVLLTVSRLATSERYKGHDLVIKALPKILQQHPGVLYLIVGDGDDEPRLRALVASMDLIAHVRFAGGVAGSELAEHYRAADVFVMPSTGEGFGIVFLEAAASGLHVIGGNVDGSLDALRNGTVGEPIDPRDTNAIAAAVCRALEAPTPPNPSSVEAFSQSHFSHHVAALAEEFLDCKVPIVPIRAC